MLVDYKSMARLELLAALQALSIYIFVRLDEGQTDSNYFDALMLSTVTVVAQHFNCNELAITQQPAQHDDLGSVWRDWIIKESVNRLCLIYRIIDMLAYFEPAAMCDLPSDLILAPLPARKQLWESSNEFAWNLESSKDILGEPVFGLPATGDLVKLSESRIHCGRSWMSTDNSNDTANWEEWCSGMDSLGGLVMLAASLVG